MANLPEGESIYVSGSAVEFQVSGLTSSVVTFARSPDKTVFTNSSVIDQNFQVLTTISSDGLFTIAGRCWIRWSESANENPTVRF